MRFGNLIPHFHQSGSQTKIKKRIDEQFGPVNVWLLAPGQGARLWQDFLDSKVAAIGWDELEDLNQYSTDNDILDRLITHYESKNPRSALRAVVDFSKVMNKGDVIIAKRVVGVKY